MLLYTNILGFSVNESKNLHNPPTALVMVPLLTKTWNYLSKPLLYKIHKLVKSLNDYKIWAYDIFLGRLN